MRGSQLLQLTIEAGIGNPKELSLGQIQHNIEFSVKTVDALFNALQSCVPVEVVVPHSVLVSHVESIQVHLFALLHNSMKTRALLKHCGLVLLQVPIDSGHLSKTRFIQNATNIAPHQFFI